MINGVWVATTILYITRADNSDWASRFFGSVMQDDCHQTFCFSGFHFRPSLGTSPRTAGLPDTHT